jgi:hypothetical protein
METLSQTFSEENNTEVAAETNSGLFGLFQVDLDNYIKIKFAFMYHMQIPPEQIESLPYYEYEEYVELLSDILKKKQQSEKESSSQQQGMDPSREASKFMRNMKMPKFK